MNSSRLPRYAASVLAAGLAGLVANALIVWMIAEADPGPMLYSPTRIVVAFAAAALLPPIHVRFPFILEDLISLLALTLIPAAVDQWALGSPAPWSEEIAFTAVYAAAALMVYRFVAEWGREVND